MRSRLLTAIGDNLEPIAKIATEAGSVPHKHIVPSVTRISRLTEWRIFIGYAMNIPTLVGCENLNHMLRLLGLSGGRLRSKISCPALGSSPVLTSFLTYLMDSRTAKTSENG